MKLILQGEFDCYIFPRAKAAIEFIHDHPVLLRETLMTPAANAEVEMEHIRDPGERRLHIEVSRLPSVFADRTRFARTSVVVADNAMPGMSGLDMLETLRHVPMRKLLLSGMVDETLAGQAIRSGLIDGYFPKHHPALHDELAACLKRLQFDYFERLTQPFAAALTRGDARFLQEPAIAEAFERFVRQYHIIEHCVLMQPPGMLGLDDAGNPVILLVADSDYRQASFEIAEAEGAPPEMLRRLISGKDLAAFPTATGFYSRELAQNWDQFLWPGTSFGACDWRCATIDQPEVVTRVCRQIVSYAEHRQRRLN